MGCLLPRDLHFYGHVVFKEKTKNVDMVVPENLMSLNVEQLQKVCDERGLVQSKQN